MKKEMVLSNAKVVLPAQVISRTVSFSDGTITAVDEGNTDTGEDMGEIILFPVWLSFTQITLNRTTTPDRVLPGTA